MVNFNSKLNDFAEASPIDPLKLYETLDRASAKVLLRESQE